MNFLKKKRKQDQENNENELPVTSKRPRLAENKQSAPRAVTSLIKKVGETVKQKVSVALKALTTSRPPDVKSELFTTPAAQKTVRYILTPWAPFSPHHSSLEWRNRGFFELNAVIPVTESRNHEFKTGGGNYPLAILPQHIRRYGSAFLNSDGGVLMAGVLDNGTVRGILCHPTRRRMILNTIDQEFSNFLPKVDKTLYQVKFIPVAYPQTFRQRREGGRNFVHEVYVIEIIVKAGRTGQLYECGNHEVCIRREGSVQGPLNPLQIKDIVIQAYREELGRRRSELAKSLEEEGPAEKAEKRKTTPAISKKRKVHISPIVIE